MFAAAICVSILLGVLVWALPGRLCDRRATHADVLAGPGIVLAVWIIAACVFAQPGLAQGFDLFRLLAINGAALWACGTVLLLRLRSGRRWRGTRLPLASCSFSHSAVVWAESGSWRKRPSAQGSAAMGGFPVGCCGCIVRETAPPWIEWP